MEPTAAAPTVAAPAATAPAARSAPTSGAPTADAPARPAPLVGAPAPHLVVEDPHVDLADERAPSESYEVTQPPPSGPAAEPTTAQPPPAAEPAIQRLTKQVTARLSSAMDSVVSWTSTLVEGNPQSTLSPVMKALSSFDDAMIPAIESGGLRFLSVAWLLQQPPDYRIQRRQDLEALEAQGGGLSPLLRPRESIALIRRCDRSVGVLT